MTQNNSITVSIMGKVFSVKSPPEKVADLREAVDYLDNKINEIHSADKVINSDSLLMITALNIANELITQKKQNLSYIEDMSRQINELQDLIENASSSGEK